MARLKVCSRAPNATRTEARTGKMKGGTRGSSLCETELISWVISAPIEARSNTTKFLHQLGILKSRGYHQSNLKCSSVSRGAKAKLRSLLQSWQEDISVCVDAQPYADGC